MTGQRRYHVVWYVSQVGVLVQGPTRGGEHELVLMDEWIKEPRELEGDEALGELGRRYLRARGVAMVEDLVYLTRLGKRECRRAFEVCGEEVVEVEVEGVVYKMLAEDVEVVGSGVELLEGHVCVLAAFDEHLFGYKVRDAVLDPEHATLVDPARNGVFRWTVVVGGRVVGTWRRVKETRRVVCEVVLFGEVSEVERGGVEEELARWGAFSGTSVEVEFVGS
jgi:uncharacterized protein YcaQ